MLSTDYFNYPYAEVNKGIDTLLAVQGFLNAGVSKAKQILISLKQLYGANSTRLFVAEGKDIYKISILQNGFEIGNVYYMPGERRLDIWDSYNSGGPLFQFRGKNAVYSGCSPLMAGAGAEKLWQKLSGVL